MLREVIIGWPVLLEWVGFFAPLLLLGHSAILGVGALVAGVVYGVRKLLNRGP